MNEDDRTDGTTPGLYSATTKLQNAMHKHVNQMEKATHDMTQEDKDHIDLQVKKDKLERLIDRARIVLKQKERKQGE